MTYVSIHATDGSGDFSAYLATPETEGEAPAILVIQEIFGVNKVMRDICDQLASEGYVAICPDIFWRQEPGIDITDQTEEEWAKAFELFQGFDVDLGVEDLKATLDFIRNHETTSGKVGSVGFCLGGKLAYLMATRSDADCNVSYYGVGLDELLGESENIAHPLLAHVAELDKFVPPEARDKIVAHFTEHPQIDVQVYEGVNHAFARKGGEHYDEAAATRAHQCTASFLRENLS